MFISDSELGKEIYMPRANKNIPTIQKVKPVSVLQTTSLEEMFVNENDLDELRDA